MCWIYVKQYVLMFSYEVHISFMLFHCEVHLFSLASIEFRCAIVCLKRQSLHTYMVTERLSLHVTTKVGDIDTTLFSCNNLKGQQRQSLLAMMK